MAVPGTFNNLVDPRDLLEMLRQHPLTAPFNLALYSEQHGRKGLVDAIHSICSPLDGEPKCINECYQAWEDELSQALLSNQPVVRTCPQGFLFFSIPLPNSKGLPDCLIGGGVYEQKASTARALENSDNPVNGDSLDLAPPLFSLSETESAAEADAERPAVRGT